MSFFCNLAQAIFALAALMQTSNGFTSPIHSTKGTLQSSLGRQRSNKNIVPKNALVDPAILETISSTTLSTASSSALFPLESIKTAFSVATFLPQPFWLLLILFPNTKITKQIMGNLSVVVVLSLVHFFIVSASIGQPIGTAPILEFNGVFDPNGDPQKAMMGMMRYPNFVSEEWSHVLTWDLFVGRWIWLDGLKRGIFTPHSVLLCNLIGPPGVLLHLATSIVTGKVGGFTDNEALNMVDNE